MKTRKKTYDIAVFFILAVTVLAYILVRVTLDFQLKFALGEDDGLRFLLPLLVAEYEILTGIGYFAFAKNGDIRKAKTRRNGMICGLLLLGSVWLQPLANILEIYRWNLPYYLGGYILCEPLQGVIILFLAIGRLINTKRERREKPEEAANDWRRAVSNVVNVIALAVSVAVSIHCMMVCIAAFFMGLLNLGLHFMLPPVLSSGV